ncbi:uncharacterized protein SPAPADRAFT_134426 [Spathaspora passalidarum NRRL Y-27907]|uniref:Agglutinin-like protein N-terminal domain-containing protein n=1 Tax=Spathaspora passalidarum (strain NRRL Y-27907 / 11-Y1) TaxID=619300 RepID=G3AJ76_SPAPN|nr:uncharacterized protein SPAPADRAFT_134426 [Spathaspora passalidarum NRRL Y-27907]EGW33833.1 hypothetical protein SPAPADRAFT_134426 [Spathaspora passalidarum NRRL Y-27907]QTC10009.1 agglutinin-like protein [Spathaspora passalidarum]
MILSLVLLQLLATFVSTQAISGVFTEFNSLTWENGGGYPYASPSSPSWMAKLGWKIDGSTMNSGDTFTLDMPCVFKFPTTQTSVDLKVGSTSYATCTFSIADILLSSSQLNCVLLSAVQDSTSATGTLTFPVAFNVGGSASSNDVSCASRFQDGVNTVTFKDGSNTLSTQATFQKGVDSDPNKIIYHARTLPMLNKMQHSLAAGNCASGYSTGTLGIKIINNSGQVDCANIHAAISNSLNDWYLPKSVSSSFSFTTTCSSSGYSISYQNVPAGYRVFIDALVSIVVGGDNTVQYLNKYVCSGSTVNNDNSLNVEWKNYQNNVAGSNGQEVVVITETWTGSTTHLTTKTHNSDDPTITVIVDVPIPTITITTTYIGVSTSYTTHTVTPGETASVIEYEPVHTTTTETSCWESDTNGVTTIIKSSLATDTVLYLTPCTTELPPTTQVTSATTTEFTSDDSLSTSSTEQSSTTKSIKYCKRKRRV